MGVIALMAFPTYHAYRHVTDVAQTGDFWGTVARELSGGGFTDSFHILVATFDFTFFFAAVLWITYLYRRIARLERIVGRAINRVSVERLRLRLFEDYVESTPRFPWLHQQVSVTEIAAVVVSSASAIAIVLWALTPWIEFPH